MTGLAFVGGTDISAIKNKEFLRIETDKAQEIVVALDKSGVPFSAGYGENEMELIFDGNFQAQVEEILAKVRSGNYDVLLRELQTYGVPDSYFRLLGEVAELLNTSVSALQNRPEDIQLMLCKTYADFWLCDTTTMKRELDRIITVNGRTLSDIQEYEHKKFQEKAPDNHAHFTRESHRHLSEIAHRRQQSERERIIQAEERERTKRI